MSQQAGIETPEQDLRTSSACMPLCVCVKEFQRPAPPQVRRACPDKSHGLKVSLPLSLLGSSLCMNCCTKGLCRNAKAVLGLRVSTSLCGLALPMAINKSHIGLELARCISLIMPAEPIPRTLAEFDCSPGSCPEKHIPQRRTDEKRDACCAQR